MKIQLLLLLLSWQLSVNAQTSLPQFGEYTVEEYQLTECAFDKSADAVILFEEGSVITGKDNTLEYSRRVRIKILKEKEVKRGNVYIPFYSSGNYEKIVAVKAVSCTMNGSGEYIKTEISKNDVFINRKDQFVSTLSFAIPNVKPGTIIEYSYTRITKGLSGLRDWYFQTELPSLLSRFKLKVPGNTEVTYKVIQEDNNPVRINRESVDETVNFELKNIPALRLEPYMDAAPDFIQKIKFEVTGKINLYGHRSSVLKNWRAAGEVISDEIVYRRVFSSNYHGHLELKQMVDSQINQKQQIKTIFDYVRRNFIWDGYTGLLPEGSLKNVWESKKGDASELNFLLLHLLSLHKIKAIPLLVAERDFGSVDSLLPSFKYFNKIVVYAESDGKTYILDATDKFSNTDLIPSSLLNTYALLADGRKSALIRLSDYSRAFKKNIIIEGAVTNKHSIIGTAWLRFEEYAASSESEFLQSKDKQAFKSYLEEHHSGLSIKTMNLNVNTNDRGLINEEISFTIQGDSSDNFILLNPNLFTGLSKNPFTANERMYDINFRYPVVINLQLEISIPEGGTAENIPSDKMLVTADKSIRFARKATIDSGKVFLRYVFTQERSIYKAEEYTGIKEFYDKMIKLLNEQLVIKLK